MSRRFYAREGSLAPFWYQLPLFLKQNKNSTTVSKSSVTEKLEKVSAKLRTTRTRERTFEPDVNASSTRQASSTLPPSHASHLWRERERGGESARERARASDWASERVRDVRETLHLRNMGRGQGRKNEREREKERERARERERERDFILQPGTSTASCKIWGDKDRQTRNCRTAQSMSVICHTSAYVSIRQGAHTKNSLLSHC